MMMQQIAHPYAEAGQPRAGATVDLWTMLNLNAGAFYLATRLVGSLRKASDPGKSDESAKKALVKQVAKLIDELGKIEAHTTRSMVAKFQADVKNDRLSRDQMVKKAENIEDTLCHELEQIVFFIIPRERRSYLDSPREQIGDAVYERFPAAEYDLDEACRCYALQRHTACVMHLMRALEVGLNDLGRQLDLTAGSNWNKDLDQIEKEIRSRNKTSHPSWEHDEAFFSGAATHLRFFKNAYRNRTMHAGVKYVDLEATSIFDASVAFLRHLATRT